MNTDIRLDAGFVFSLMFMLGGVLLVLAFHEVPEKNMTLFASLSTGVITSSLGMYFGYRWGSSKGSAAKDDTIQQLTTQAANNAQDHGT